MGKGFSRLASSDGSIDLNAMKIEETKFLGGDLEHTHLVKGLDYALLNKERARIQKSESESIKKEKQKQQKRSKVKPFVEFGFRTRTGISICDADGKGGIQFFI